MKEVNMKLTFDETVVLFGLLTGHRISMVDKVAPNHWEMLESLHKKFVNALVEAGGEK